MNLVFDGPAQPMGLALHSLLALAPLGVWAFLRYVRRQSSTWMLPAIAGVWFFGSNGIQLWDQWRIGEIVRKNDGLQITRGSITESWHIESRTRDWSSSSLRYKTTVSEGFDAGGVRFRWNIGDSFSPATFSNAGDPPLTFPKGTQVEVTWFVDPADQDERRIVRIRMAQAGAVSGAVPAGFQAFQTRFAQAFAAGDTQRLTSMTLFPLRFGGHSVDAERAPSVWMGLLMPALQSCIGSAMPAPVEGGAMALHCHRTRLLFRSGADGWALVEVSQEP